MNGGSRYGVSEGGYREAAQRTRVTARFRTYVRAYVSGTGLMAILLFLLVAFPIGYFPGRIDVACGAAANTCDVSIQRVFFTSTETVDMHDALSVGFEHRGSGKNAHTLIAVQTANNGRRLYAFPNGLSGGEELVGRALVTFLKDPTTNLTATHDGRVFLAMALFVWLAFSCLTMNRMVTLVDVRAECDGVQLSVRISQFPYRSRSRTVPIADVVGVRMEVVERPMRNGAIDTTHSRVLLAMKGGVDDLFLHEVLSHPSVQAMTQSLDQFIKKQVEGT